MTDFKHGDLVRAETSYSKSTVVGEFLEHIEPHESTLLTAAVIHPRGGAELRIGEVVFVDRASLRPAVADEAVDEDVVNHPSHYTSHPSGVECIRITEHMSFTLGNAVKYIWRADLKGDAIEDLKKARFYIDRELAKREKTE